MANISQEEIDKHLDQLHRALKNDSSSEVDKFKSWSLNYFLKHKERYIADLQTILSLHEEGTIVEIGSLPCHLTYLLKNMKLNVIGLDLNPSRLASFTETHNLNVVKCDIECEPFPIETKQASVVVFNETFEHLRCDPSIVLSEIRRILKVGGILILTTPNLRSFKNMSLMLRGKPVIDPAKEKAKLEGVGHMGHVREYTADEMKSILISAGFQIDKINYKYYKFHSRKKKFKDILHMLFKKRRPYLELICSRTN